MKLMLHEAVKIGRKVLSKLSKNASMAGYQLSFKDHK